MSTGSTGDRLETQLDSTVRSLAEEVAVARATTDRLRTERDRTWRRALTARERRDALIAHRQRLLEARSTRPAEPAGGVGGTGATGSGRWRR